MRMQYRELSATLFNAKSISRCKLVVLMLEEFYVKPVLLF